MPDSSVSARLLCTTGIRHACTCNAYAVQFIGQQIIGVMLLRPMIQRLQQAPDLRAMLQGSVLDLMSLVGAERGNIQLMGHNEELVIVAQQGFGARFLEVFQRVRAGDGSVCARAAERRSLVLVPDVEQDPAFAPYLELARSIPFTSVMSCPLITSKGMEIGIASVHFARLFAPTPLELETAQRYCGHLADSIAVLMEAEQLVSVAEALADELLQVVA